MPCFGDGVDTAGISSCGWLCVRACVRNASPSTLHVGLLPSSLRLLQVCQGTTPPQLQILELVPIAAPGDQPYITIRNSGGQTANLTGACVCCTHMPSRRRLLW